MSIGQAWTLGLAWVLANGVYRTAPRPVCAATRRPRVWVIGPRVPRLEQHGDASPSEGKPTRVSGDAMPSGEQDSEDLRPTWRSTLRAASIFVLVSLSVALAFYGLR